MTVFRDTQHLYKVLGMLFERVVAEPDIHRALVKSGILVQFTFKEPEGKILLDLRKSPISIIYDPTGYQPDVEFIQSGDNAHQFWLGELSMTSAVATRKVIAKGSVPKAVALLPAIQPVFSLYPEMLREIGFSAIFLSLAAFNAIPFLVLWMLFKKAPDLDFVKK